jgi:hypothetical protein
MSMKSIVGILAVLGLGWAVSTAEGEGFTDVTGNSGVGALREQHPGTWFSGVSLVDLDGDGHLDFFVSSHGGGGSCAALNNGAGHFTPIAGGQPRTEIHISCDIDEDGKVDLSMTYTDGGGQWWMNKSTPGNVSFVAQGVTWGNARQQSLIDINKDGKMDWLIGVERRGESTENKSLTMEYGDGTGHFAKGSKTMTIPSPNDGVTPMAVDLDNDGNEDLVVEWGRYEYERGRSSVFHNDGKGNFTDVTTEVGLYKDNLAILGFGDYNQDGFTDLIGLENQQFPLAIFLNDGHGHFKKLDGAITGEPGGRPQYAGWGMACMVDFDNDGIPDIIVGGRAYTHVLHGTGGGKFTCVNTDWGISRSGDGNLDNCYAFGDIDHDGDLDLAVHPQSRNPIMYKNDLPAKNWVNLRLTGLPGNKAAAGSKIRIYEAGTTKLLWYEEVAVYCKQAQQNYYNYGVTERHMGLDTRKAVDVEVEFYPSGTKVKKAAAEANKTWIIDEKGGTSELQAPPAAPAETDKAK